MLRKAVVHSLQQALIKYWYTVGNINTNCFAAFPDIKPSLMLFVPPVPCQNKLARDESDLGTINQWRLLHIASYPGFHSIEPSLQT